MTLDEFDQWLAQRHSVRAFTDELVPRPLIDKIFSAAQRAPSNCNSQPWRVWLVRGEACNRLRARVLAAIDAGEIYPQEFPAVEHFEGPLRQRQVDCARALYGAMGIARQDKSARWAAMRRNYAFFDAPQVAFIGMDKRLGFNNALDVGLYVQNLVLALHAAGLGACVQGALAHHAPIVRDCLGIDADCGLLTGVSFGFAAQAPANSARTVRAPLAEVLRVVE